MKRGAIGLAINMIVIIILSIVILGLGIAFLQSIMGGANDLKADLDAQTSNELERLMMDQNKKVAVPLNTATLFGGDTHVFGVGILNILTIVGSQYLLNKQNILIQKTTLIQPIQVLTHGYCTVLTQYKSHRMIIIKKVCL